MCTFIFLLDFSLFCAAFLLFSILQDFLFSILWLERIFAFFCLTVTLCVSISIPRPTFFSWFFFYQYPHFYHIHLLSYQHVHSYSTNFIYQISDSPPIIFFLFILGQSITPPNGLQLTLLSATTSFSTSSLSKRSDTLVMQNLGKTM